MQTKLLDTTTDVVDNEKPLKRGDLVNYEPHGLGRIVDEPNLNNEKYFKIRILHSDLTILCPAQGDGLKKIFHAESPQNMLTVIYAALKSQASYPEDPRSRVNMHNGLLETGLPLQAALVAVNLYDLEKTLKQTGSVLSDRELSQKNLAVSMCAEAISECLNVTEEQAAERIVRYITTRDWTFPSSSRIAF